VVTDRILRLHKHDGLLRDDPVPSATINIDMQLLPDSTPGVFEQDAAALVDLLWDTLPGGTIDQVLVELMRRRASVLRVGLLSVEGVLRLNEARHGTDVVG
jgi:hypothetical protein